ncbi:hypothetical protein MTO96_004128 [Rhipicephalus appendiculatus]
MTYVPKPESCPGMRSVLVEANHAAFRTASALNSGQRIAMELLALPLALLLTCALGMPQQNESGSAASMTSMAAGSSSTSASANATTARTGSGTQSGPAPVVCYYSAWANSRPHPANYGVKDIPGDLCTHVNFAYAGVNPQTWELRSEVPEFERKQG